MLRLTAYYHNIRTSDACVGPHAKLIKLLLLLLLLLACHTLLSAPFPDRREKQLEGSQLRWLSKGDQGSADACRWEDMTPPPLPLLRLPCHIMSFCSRGWVLSPPLPLLWRSMWDSALHLCQ
jgi:hypothetical protein